MADAWGSSWGTSWGASWGAGAVPVAVTPTYYGGGKHYGDEEDWGVETLRVMLQNRKVPEAAIDDNLRQFATIRDKAAEAEAAEDVRALFAEEAERLARIKSAAELEAAIEALFGQAMALMAEMELKRRNDNDALALLLLAA